MNGGEQRCVRYTEERGRQKTTGGGIGSVGGWMQDIYFQLDMEIDLDATSTSIRQMSGPDITKHCRKIQRESGGMQHFSSPRSTVKNVSTKPADQGWSFVFYSYLGLHLRVEMLGSPLVNSPMQESWRCQAHWNH